MWRQVRAGTFLCATQSSADLGYTKKIKRGREQRHDTTVNPLAKKKLPPTGRKPGGFARASGSAVRSLGPPSARHEGPLKSIPCYGGASDHYRIELSNIKGL